MSESLKLISWNVHFPTFAKDNTYVINTLETLGSFDVICLQEYAEGGDDKLSAWFREHRYDVVYLPFANIDEFSQGVLIATHKKLKAKVEPVVLRKDSAVPKRPFANIRGLLTATLHVAGQELAIHNIHLTYPRLHTREMRSREFTKLKKFLANDASKHPWLMCGDFNFFGTDTRRKYLKTTYQNFTGTLSNKTWRHHKKFTPIRSNLDYFFWNGDEIRLDADLAPFNSSDHRPMIATIDLN